MKSSQVCAGLEITELRLGLPGSDSIETNPVVGKKRSFVDACDSHEAQDAGSSTRDGNDSNQPPVVGWPPIRSYRKNHLKKAKADEKEMRSEVRLYVKVSMDGAPFLRKIQLKAYKGYSDLSHVLPTMFSDLSPLGDGCANSEYIAIYEDKDHDWMLVGDVPWEMFVQSCKRLRIMRRTEVIDVGTGHKDARRRVLSSP